MFSNMLRKLREERDWTMEYLAKEYNQLFGSKMNKGTISRYENGLQEPMYHTVVNFAKLFGVSTDYLADEESPPNTETSITSTCDNDVDELKTIFTSLNPQGKKELIKYGNLLLKSEEYTVQEFNTAKREKVG